MSQTSLSSFRPSDLIRLLQDYPRRWVAPALAIVAVCGLYAVCKPKQWQASQTLLVRNDAANSESIPGRFRDSDEMKVTHETILEMVKSHRVLEDALREVRPASGLPSAAWPTSSHVDQLREAVSLNAPSGIEFGKAEISHLSVRDVDQRRAVALAAAVGKHLEAALRRVRAAKAKSMVEELAKTVGIGESDLDESTQRLCRLEQQVGADLSDLRNMELNATGDSDLRRRLNSIEDELRQARADEQANTELKKLLVASQSGAGHLVATPSRLLQSQPALQRLKDGLVSAQLKTSQVLGQMSQEHPIAIAAREEEREIAGQLHHELAVAVRGVELDLRLASERVASLEAQRQDLSVRLNRLAGLRPRYSTVLAEVKHRTESLADARRKLAVARAVEAGAQTAGSITFIDKPILGSQPLGPSTATLLIVGVVGGLVTGLGVLFLTATGLPPEEEIVEGPPSGVRLKGPEIRWRAIRNGRSAEPV
jgi:uncharacterized protein involved in exopolysaccharide biosynthesis